MAGIRTPLTPLRIGGPRTFTAAAATLASVGTLVMLFKASMVALRISR